MASGFSTAKRNAILTAEFKTASPFGALCNADPGDAGDMVGQEVAALYAYARTAVVFVTDAVAGSIANTTALAFPVNTAGGDWGIITHLAIVTAAVEGVDDMVASGSLTVSKTIGVGDQLTFAIGAIVATLAAQA